MANGQWLMGSPEHPEYPFKKEKDHAPKHTFFQYSGVVPLQFGR